MVKELFTMGYSGHTLESFLARLKTEHIEVVADVRQNPLSRKPGFSRRGLSAFLESHGVAYAHFPPLGVPRPLRDQLRDQELTIDAYLASFREYVVNERAALESLRDLSQRQRCCLLCMEQDHRHCHRSIVAAAVAELPGSELRTVHL